MKSVAKTIDKKNLYITSETGNFNVLLSVPVEKIKNELLGKDYDFTLIYCSPKTSKKLNSELRDKDYPTNILSFPLDKKLGEIYICRSVAKRDAKNFNMSYTQFITLLIVHGCLHLKGLEHGDVMDTLENEYTKKYYSPK